MSQKRTVGRPGSRASVRRAVKWRAWFDARGRVPKDVLRHVRYCGRDGSTCIDTCRFLCRGCNRFVLWSNGGAGEDNVRDYLCDPCANAHEAS